MPATLVGFSLQSLSLGEDPAPSSGDRCPPAVAARRLRRPSGPAGSASDPDRLQGLSPLPSPPPPRGLLTYSARAAALLGFLPLQGFPPSRDGTGFPAPPRPKPAPRPAPRIRTPARPLRVFLHGKVGLAPKSPPTLMRFLPSAVLAGSDTARPLDYRFSGNPGVRLRPLAGSPSGP